MVLVKIRVNLHTIFFGTDEVNVCEDNVVLFRVVTITNEAHKLEDGQQDDFKLTLRSQLKLLLTEREGRQEASSKGHVF